MLKRMIVMLAATLTIVAALGFVKFKQVQTAIAQGAAFQPPPESVTTIVANEEKWPSTLTAIGTVAAVRGVTVSADLPGVVDRIAFESGQSIREGETLALLDTRQERAQMAAADAQRELARVNFDRMKGLLSEHVVSQAEFDRANAEQRQADARVGEIRATIDRKTIRAPFNGILGIRHVNLGQYLSGGDALVTLQSLNPIYVNFGVPQQAIASVRAGHMVRVTVQGTGSTGAPGGSGADGDIEFSGPITAIDSVVNESTRNITAQATLANPQGKLRPGMFVQAGVAVGASTGVVSVPASAINHAPYGDSVFVVADLKDPKDPKGASYRGVRQQFVKLGPSRGDQVGIVSGVKAGDEVVTSGLFKLRNGAAVQVNNKVRPGNNPSPKPENS
jgi:membrane fusion protein (multidrug efflux system)